MLETVGTLVSRGPLAQLVEQGTLNPKVVGSIPTRPTRACATAFSFGGQVQSAHATAGRIDRTVRAGGRAHLRAPGTQRRRLGSSGGRGRGGDRSGAGAVVRDLKRGSHAAGRRAGRGGGRDRPGAGGGDRTSNGLELELALVLLAVSAIAARYALRPGGHDRRPASGATVAAPSHPVLIMNRWSGGGKVEKFGLVEECRRRGIEPVVLERGDDLLQLAADAVDRGADVIGMAGGDGSQALVASVAADRGVPHVCIPAGTRNHFALDLGLDRDDVVGALDAFGEAVERRIDLATVNGRVFVNNASMGVYAKIVQSPEYRDAKLKTAAAMLPGHARDRGAEPFDLRFAGPDGEQLATAHVILVSNDPYQLDHLDGRGTRPAWTRARWGSSPRGSRTPARRSSSRRSSRPAGSAGSRVGWSGSRHDFGSTPARRSRSASTARRRRSSRRWCSNPVPERCACGCPRTRAAFPRQRSPVPGRRRSWRSAQGRRGRHCKHRQADAGAERRAGHDVAQPVGLQVGAAPRHAGGPAAPRVHSHSGGGACRRPAARARPRSPRRRRHGPKERTCRTDQPGLGRAAPGSPPA